MKYFFTHKLSLAVLTSLMIPVQSIWATRLPDEGPIEGGTIQVPHPEAAKGLIRIDKKRNYIYELSLPQPRNQWRFSVGNWSPPKIETSRGPSFESMYGSNNLISMFGSYDYKFTQAAGSWFANLGAGFSSVQGTGTLSGGQAALEKYSLLMFPVSLGVSWEIDFLSRFVTPFLEAGGTYVGLIETRDDGGAPVTAGAWSTYVGGGLKLSVTAFSRRSAITLANQYGIRGLWIVVQGQSRIGINKDLDFTSSYYGLGLAFGL